MSHEQIQLIAENIKSYQELIKDMECRAVMARLQGKRYYQEDMVYAARHHLQKLKERHQALIQRYPQHYSRRQADDESSR
jgi:hypothetical protein